MKRNTVNNRVVQFVRKVIIFVRLRAYVNETLLLFEHIEHAYQVSPAKITNITHENVTDILDFRHQKYKSIFEKFLQRGDKGYFAYLNGKCVHNSWVVHSPQKIHLHPMLLRQLEKGVAFIHYCETAPNARGQNIFPSVLSKIVDDFKKNSQRLMISANEKNSSSIKAIQKAGFKEIERYKIIVILGIKYKRCIGK